MSESIQTRRMYGHNYAVQGTYEVTMVVAERRPVFGEIVGSTMSGGERPRLMPSALGAAVINNEIPKIHDYYPMVDVWQVCLMPDHIHMIVRISRPLPQGKHLGIIIGAFKGGVSRAWWQLSAPASVASAADASCASLRAQLQRPHPDARRPVGQLETLSPRQSVPLHDAARVSRFVQAFSMHHHRRRALRCFW